jgi:dTDP-4-amino-4,6-dideoxygalactose transaminase
MNKFLPFACPAIGKEEINSVIRVLKSGWISTGPQVRRFEELFAEYLGVRYACALSSCSAALHLSLLASGIGKNDEVIVSPFTYPATANAIVHVQGKPVFVDIDARTMNINPDLIMAKINARTKAIILVHFAGRPCDMRRIMDVVRKYKLIVIDDASHALGAQYYGKKIGSISDLTCFSLYANKNITTAEGGMVTTNNRKLIEKIRVLSFNGIDKRPWERFRNGSISHYRFTFPGYKYNMTDIEAAIGIEQLKKLNNFLKRREEVWEAYDREFRGLAVSIPSPVEPFTRHARHLYTLIVDKERSGINRDDFRLALRKMHVGTGLHFISLHLQPYYQRTFGFRRGDLPVAAYISERIVSLPLSANLSNKDVKRIIRIVKDLL